MTIVLSNLLVAILTDHMLGSSSAAKVHRRIASHRIASHRIASHRTMHHVEVHHTQGTIHR